MCFDLEKYLAFDKDERSVSTFRNTLHGKALLLSEVSLCYMIACDRVQFKPPSEICVPFLNVKTVETFLRMMIARIWWCKMTCSLSKESGMDHLPSFDI